MSLYTKRVINDNWETLVKDLQGDVILETRSILTDEEYDKIFNLVDDHKMIHEFLSTIVKKNDKELKIFIDNLKQYYPWLHEKLKGSMEHLTKTDPLYKVKTLGGIPNLPQRIIERSELVNQLRNGLKKLKNGEYIVLHGMIGSGKTTLAAASLDNDDLVKNYFRDGVFWLTVGEIEGDLGFLQQTLNEKFPYPVQELSPLPKLATIQITKVLLDKGLNDCLIVLDDVKCKSVIDCFAIGAKFLITTENKCVVGSQLQSHASFIKVDEGFSSRETLELFSKCLGVKDHSLPDQASHIHQYTKGHPLIVSLIASQLENFKESFLKDETRWNQCVEVLANKKCRRRSYNEIETLYNALQDSVKSLGKEKEILFRKLAVFVEDVNIKPEVIGILWSLSKYEAEDIMLEFVRKSLAVMKWNDLQSSYVYGLHNLVSDFLKKDLSKDQEMELHKNFISEYFTKCNGVWCKLPNDNYIFYYIGYHLRKAGLIKFFQTLYFDLSFLEAKLRVSGPADVIRDFKIYKDLITNKTLELEKRNKEFLNFIEYHGFSIAQGIDIIQAAILEPIIPSVHKAAVDLVKSQKLKQLYLYSFPLTPVEGIILPSTIEIKESIQVISFGSTRNEVIIATEYPKRKLMLWNIRAKGILRKFKGQFGRITNIDVSDCKSRFLSSSLDNSVCIWSLESGDRTPSPRERQSNYVDFFVINEVKTVGKDKAIFVLKHRDAIIWAVFSKHSPSLVASLGNRGTITVWNNDEKLWEEKQSDSIKLKCLDFFDDDRFIAAGGNNMVILLFRETGTFYKSVEYPNFISLRSLPASLGGGLVILMKHQLAYCSRNTKEDHNHNLLPIRKEPLSYKALHSVGTNIAVTTDSDELYVFHFLNGSIVAYFPQMTRMPASICVNDRAILSGFEDGSLVLYPLDMLPCPLTHIKWKQGHKPVLLKMDHVKENIEVIIGQQTHIIAERSNTIKAADVSRDGTVIVTACESGEVIYNALNDQKEVIIKRNKIPFKLLFLEQGLEKIVILFYRNEETMVWKERGKILIKLNEKSKDSSFANLFQGESEVCLITGFPTSMWTLDGTPVASFLPDFSLCDNFGTSQDFKNLLYVIGEKTWLVGGTSKQAKTLDVLPPKCFSFSPSGIILALLNEQGILTILNCEKNIVESIREIPKQTNCLAVSNNACVCYGSANHLSMVTKYGISSKMVLNTSSIVVEPDGIDQFAVADNAGIVYIVQFDDIAEDVLKEE